MKQKSREERPEEERALGGGIPHLTMKSNSEPASMRTPSRVEKAPSSTGANMCSRARMARLFRSPMAVRKAW